MSETQSALTKQNGEMDKIWNRNYFLLWQGQFVSEIGSVFYQIALGFWILATTGSTGMMGILMAITSLATIIASPFAGVIVDRTDRKMMIVCMDLVRGVAVIFVALASFRGTIQLWMVFSAGVILGICGAFFNPAASSSLPDLVPKSKVMQANSLFSMIYIGTKIIGNPIAGILYTVLGAPLLFLVNGISFVLSAITELFVKIPKIVKEQSESKVGFFDELKDGLSFVWKLTGLRTFILIAAIINFLGVMAITLILPLFQRTEGLGSGKYGIAIAIYTGGMFIGMVLTSSINIPPAKRRTIFTFCIIFSSVCLAFFPFFNFWLMCTFLFIGGLFNAVVNVFLNSIVQITVPAQMRGKVIALATTILTALTPLAMATSGILAEFIAIKYIILYSFGANIFISTIPTFFKSFKTFINFNPETQTIKDLM